MAEDERLPTTGRLPRERIEVGELVVRRYVEDDAEAMEESVTESLEHLRPWMEWIAHEPLGIEQRRALIREWSDAWDAGRNFVMGIFDGAMHVGGTGLHPRSGPGVLEIGYWVRVSRAGEGIIGRVVLALVEEAFSLGDITTVEIHHDAGNLSSRRVAEKAGFTLVDEREVEPKAPAETGRHLRWVTTRER